MNPPVSVVIPAYNAAGFLGAALDSALAQTFGDCEVLVVDDGSTDETRAIARRYGDRIRLVCQPNAGAAAARNRGVRQAGAPTIAFLDADDLWHRDHLETLVGLLHRNPDVIGAASGVEILSRDGGSSGQRWIFGSDGEDLLSLARKGCPLLTSAVLLRRDVFLEVGGFDESMSNCHDWDLWLRLLSRGRFALAGRVTVGYRRHGGALSMDREARARSRRTIVAKHAGEPWANVLAAYVELHHARHALATGDVRAFEESLAQAGTLHPGLSSDLQWWAFFESFRPHGRPETYPRRRFWQAVIGVVRISTSRAVPFPSGHRYRALASGLEVAGHFARLDRLEPEAHFFRWLSRFARMFRQMPLRPWRPQGRTTKAPAGKASPADR